MCWPGKMPGFFIDIYIMCGIAGILSLNFNNVSIERLKQMTDAIAHRGPDGEGFWKNNSGHVALGHRRLSIIDLSTNAAQPMHYLDRYTIVHNGEVYNYIELKQQLQAKGYQFRTHSDTEVILAAYDCYKQECIQYLDGMFAFAIWDEKEQQLFAVRDRFGEKPFYYYKDSGRFIFASEMKALWAIGIEKKTEDKMLLNYITLGYVQNASDRELTFYKHIYSLPPAHSLIINLAEGLASTAHKYWDIDKETKINISEKDAIEKFDELFTTSVTRRWRSDVAVGSSLSGGLDSSSIIFASQQVISGAGIHHGSEGHKTFSAVFPDFEKNESSYIDMIAEKFNCTSYRISPTAVELANDFDKLCFYQEEPFPSSSIYAQFRVVELAKQHSVTVLLDGQGADESLAGYHKYIHWYLQELVSRYRFTKAKNEKRALHKNNAKIRWGPRNIMAAFLPAHASIQLEKKEYSRSMNSADISKEFLRSLRGQEWEGIQKPVVTKLNDILYFNTMQNGLEELLRFADRNSMAHGREIRLPFLDHRLVQFIFSLPASFKIQDGWTKILLRKMMNKRLPDEIVWRKEKVGYEPPQELWMRDRSLQDKIHEAKKKLVKAKILSPKALSKKIEPKSAYEDNNFDWRYLCIAEFI